MMSKEFSRADRVADAVKRLLATMIQQELGDPRVGMVNINEVSVTRDLAIAKVYVTFIGHDNDELCVEGIETLNKAAGYLRSLLSKAINLRSAPKLQFFYDQTPARGQALSGLIRRARAQDDARAALGDESNENKNNENSESR